MTLGLSHGARTNAGFRTYGTVFTGYLHFLQRFNLDGVCGLAIAGNNAP